MTQGATAGRRPALRDLIAEAEVAVMAAAGPGSDARRAAAEVFDRARARTGAPPPDRLPVRLPVLDWLGAAVAIGLAGARAPVARALEALAPDLDWRRRAAAEGMAPPFRDGHANAMLCGPGGLEERDDLWIGVTLMAPGMTYSEHRHPPEEIYLSLTPGEWWNGAMDWTDPGPDGVIYNPPGIAHAMRSGSKPFLALWLLPT